MPRSCVAWSGVSRQRRNRPDRLARGMSQPYHLPLEIQGRTYEFSHLEPFQMDVDSTKVGRTLRIHVRFTMHCFTKGYNAATHHPNEPVLRDAGGRARSFCTVRYGLSPRGAHMIRALNNPKAAVMQTAEERNWLHSVTVDQPDGKYHVFFELRRTPPVSRHLQDLSLVVESAYPQDTANRLPAVRGSMGFILLCGKVYTGEPVATRR
jgi:hypothetical protein